MSTYAKRVRDAVNDEGWQTFRRSLKGISTADKLDALQTYWKHGNDEGRAYLHNYYDAKHAPMNVSKDCDICIRVDNYLKALMRGGQLTPFLDLSYFIHVSNPGPWRNCMTWETIDGLRRKVSVIRK